MFSSLNFLFFNKRITFFQEFLLELFTCKEYYQYTYQFLSVNNDLKNCKVYHKCSKVVAYSK